MFLFVFTGCGGDRSDTTPPVETGQVSGKVISATTGVPIPNARLRVGEVRATSDADGKYTLNPDAGERILVHVEATGFAETFQITRVTPGETAVLDLQLLPIAVTVSLNVATGDTVDVPNSTAQVIIPPSGLVPILGGIPAETVNVSLTPINPADDVNLMPGDYTGVLAAGGSPVSIESFGALLVDIQDADGRRYSLAEGQSSIIRIPLGTLSSSPPPIIPLFYFDETNGLWVEEGEATLTGVAPDQYYEGTVTHFSFWNADIAMDTIFVSGCVLDSRGQAVANIRVTSTGIDYSGSASARTDASGNFSVAIRSDSQATIKVPFDQSWNPLNISVEVGPSTSNFTLTSCLVLEAAPLSIATVGLISGWVNSPYIANLAAFGGTQPYAWSVISGDLPAGLILDSTTGQISGTPTIESAFPMTIQVQDSAIPAESVSEEFNITILPESSLVAGESGTLTITDAPDGIGARFVARYVASDSSGEELDGSGFIYWSNLSETTDLSYTFEPSTNEILGVSFGYGGVINEAEEAFLLYNWYCGEGTGFNLIACSGVTVDRDAGTIHFSNMTLNPVNTSQQPIIIDGTLNFPPF